MMNYIWMGLVVSAVVYGGFAGTMDEVSRASIDSAKSAVTLALGLIGVMAFWLGLMNIVRDAGLFHTLARAVRPVMTRLFPEVPSDHPAMSAMIMNIAANMLGLANAATPFGIKAMIELNRLNPVPGVASNAMVLFLAINTSNVALFPTGVIALRAAAGSENAGGIWIPTLLATSFSTVVGIFAARTLQRLVAPADSYPAATGDAVAETAAPAEVELAPERQSTTLGRIVLAGFLIAIGVAAALTVRGQVGSGVALSEVLRSMTSTWLLPVLIGMILCYGFAKQVPLYDSAISGAREGFDVAVRIIPYLVAILVAVGMFRASGLLAAFTAAIGPWSAAVGLPAEALPMAVLRPLSGSGAYAVMAEIMQAEGPDTYVGYLVSTLQGSTETTFYVLAVYFGAVGVSRIRHGLAAGLIADVAGVVGAVAAVSLLLK